MGLTAMVIGFTLSGRVRYRRSDGMRGSSEVGIFLQRYPICIEEGVSTCTTPTKP